MVKSGSTFILGPWLISSILPLPFHGCWTCIGWLVGWLVGGHVGHSFVKVKCFNTL
jgi:hypothetical protein